MRPRVRLRSRTRRGDDGLASETSVIVKPEIGERVRLLHRAGGGQYVFDYPAEAALELGRDLIAAGRRALDLRRELEREASPRARDRSREST